MIGGMRCVTIHVLLLLMIFPFWSFVYDVYGCNSGVLAVPQFFRDFQPVFIAIALLLLFFIAGSRNSASLRLEPRNQKLNMAFVWWIHSSFCDLTQHYANIRLFFF